MENQKENKMNRKTTHIFLAGGGDEKDSKLLDEQFVKKLNLAKPLVYIPNAIRSKPYQSCLKWFRSSMTPLGVVTIEMWEDLNPRHKVNNIAGVYIGGGNTIKLLKEIRESGFENYLREAAQRGIPLYGGSAGAIILGEDIRTTTEAKNLTSSEAVGLKIIKGFSIACHYKTSDEKIVQKLSKTLNRDIIAIPEKSGGYIEKQTLTNYGTEPLTIVLENQVNLVNPNHSIKLM